MVLKWVERKWSFSCGCSVRLRVIAGDSLWLIRIGAAPETPKLRRGRTQTLNKKSDKNGKTWPSVCYSGLIKFSFSGAIVFKFAQIHPQNILKKLRLLAD